MKAESEKKSWGLDDPRILSLVVALDELSVKIREPLKPSESEVGFRDRRNSMIKVFRLKSRILLSLLPTLVRLETETFILDYE